jgi:hypothetical protein
VAKQEKCQEKRGKHVEQEQEQRQEQQVGRRICSGGTWNRSSGARTQEQEEWAGGGAGAVGWAAEQEQRHAE